MLNKVLRTPVDDLVSLVEKKKSCKISFLVSSLKIPGEIIERWLVILEEFGVLKLKYSGFEGYVEFIKNNNKSKSESSKIDVDKLKEVFLKKSKYKNFSANKISQLWVLFISKYENEIKELFIDKAKKMNYSQIKIDKAWIKYKEDLNKL